MKKVLLTAMALLTIASTSAFGYYGANSDWIDFLVMLISSEQDYVR